MTMTANPPTATKTKAAHDRTTCQAADRHDDLDYLLDTGEHLLGAARRVGLSLDSFYAWCRRHDELDLYARLAERIDLSLQPNRH